MVISPDSIIRAVNPGNNTVKINGIEFPPGADKFVTFLWMVNHYGDPRSIPNMPQVVKHPKTGQSMAVQPRQTEINRINVIWGIPEVKKTWDEIPKIEFYDGEDGTRILTPFDDPSGESTTSAHLTVAGEAAYQDRIEKLERTLDMLMKATGTPKENLPFDFDNPPTAESEIPTDDSTASTVQSPWTEAEPLLPSDDLTGTGN